MDTQQLLVPILENWNKLFKGEINGNVLTFDNNIGKGRIDAHCHRKFVVVVRFSILLKEKVTVVGNKFNTDTNYYPIFIGEPQQDKYIEVEVNNNIEKIMSSNGAFTTNDENSLYWEFAKGKEINFLSVRLLKEYFYQFVDKTPKLKSVFPLDHPFYILEEFTAEMSSVFMRTFNVEEDSNYKDEMLHSCGVHLTAMFFSAVTRREVEGEENKYPLNTKAVLNARAILKGGATQNISIDELSREVGLSASRLRALFKQVFGVTIHQYHTDVKLDHARQLLLENEKATYMIAVELGFSSASHFTTAFKKRFNMTPKEFKLKYLKKD